jgi:hypothetical protein
MLVDLVVAPLSEIKPTSQEFVKVGEIGEERRVRGQGGIACSPQKCNWSRKSFKLRSVGVDF